MSHRQYRGHHAGHQLRGTFQNPRPFHPHVQKRRPKDLLNPSRPASEAEKKLVQDMVAETFEKFSSIVVTERDFPDQKLPTEVADGRIVSGKQAFDLKLIDATGYLQDAIADAREIAKLPENAPVIRYNAPFHFSRLFRFLGQKQDTNPKVQVSLVPESFHLQAGKLYYLSTHLFFRQ
ncbi:MAG: hypothetical protein ABS32_03680 [Verrucomicrobia subdivision 6 bacterium BACL9 MAG-120820-bin42]|uniref:Peptidase S49 domain-containing protein n=2 Tax=Verrucomicrobia subdivision 6 TaxID=134627 RepID=A0A0R2XD51_9BACT|nr:MAG: hypothetical protein ABS32_03680 [Verrucomicrobia subdivision 6 bacterium BACL9 MAG-120820-bin42]